MNFKHAPIFRVEAIAEYYSKRDGVPIKYVCTSALTSEERAMDIFYRDTPHPQFGNKYFGVFLDPVSSDMMITNADIIEGAEFACIQDKDGNYWYSSHRHDCLFIDGGMIDGGRAYIRTNGCDYTMFKVKDGELSKVA